MLNYNTQSKQMEDYSHRSLTDLEIISKTDSRKLNDALYQILHAMDKCGLVDQRGYNILIQLLALKIYDEKHNNGNLQFYINPDEMKFANITDDSIQTFLKRIDNLRTTAINSQPGSKRPTRPKKAPPPAVAIQKACSRVRGFTL